MRRLLLCLPAALLLAVACQSTTPAETAVAKPDPRQGAEVNDICFSSQIRDWRALGRDAVIVRRGVRDEFKLELSGTCDPRNAFLSIGLVSRFGGGSCVSRGDRLVTDERYVAGPCLISRIYEWREDAANPAGASEAGGSESK
jgi:hypothetical protein